MLINKNAIEACNPLSAFWYFVSAVVYGKKDLIAENTPLSLFILT